MLSLSTLYLIWSASAKVMIDDKVIAPSRRKGFRPAFMSRRLGRLIPFCGVAWPSRETIILKFGHRSLMTLVRSKSAGTSKFGVNRGRLEPKCPKVTMVYQGTIQGLGVRQQNFISDLRMGVEGAYVFNFEVGLRSYLALR